MLTSAQLLSNTLYCCEKKPSDVYRNARRLFFSLRVGEEVYLESHGKIRTHLQQAAKDIATVSSPSALLHSKLHASRIDVSNCENTLVYTRMQIPHDDICRELALNDFYISEYWRYKLQALREPVELPPQFKVYREYLIGAAWNIYGLFIKLYEYDDTTPFVFHPCEYGTCIETIRNFLTIGLGIVFSEIDSQVYINAENLKRY